MDAIVVILVAGVAIVYLIMEMELLMLQCHIVSVVLLVGCAVWVLTDSRVTAKSLVVLLVTWMDGKIRSVAQFHRVLA